MSALNSFDNYWSSITNNEEYLKVYGQHAISDWKDRRHQDLDDVYADVKPYLQKVSGGDLIYYSLDGLNCFCAENYHEALIEFLNPPEKWFRKLWILDSEEYLTLKKKVVAEEKQVLELPSNTKRRQLKPSPDIPKRKLITNQSKDCEIYKFICPEKLYTLQAFKKRLGVADTTLRSARRAGLRVTYLHKQGYVYGRDWIEYVLNSNPNHSHDPASDS